MANPMLQSACNTLETKLHEKGFTHLQVRVHGTHLVIYSEDGDFKENRARFTQLKQQHYGLGMATHRGKWEPTPYSGSLNELLDLLTGQLAFTLAAY